MDPLQQAVEKYQMSDESRQLLSQSPIVMMVSITGGGKNTIIEELLKTDKYHYVISHTTRPPRENHGVLEQNGVNYWFVSEEKMLEKLQGGDFIEAKWVHNSYVYGTSVDELHRAQDSGRIPLLEIDVQGVDEIKHAKPDAKAIFIVPPDYNTWMQRLSGRGELTDVELAKRVLTAKKELTTALSSDYFQFLVNDDLQTAVQNSQRLIAGESVAESAKTLAENLLSQIKK